MTHKEQISWMESWCKKQGLTLQLEGECGFGRECVGVVGEGLYPDYEWFDENYKRIDSNGEVWRPLDAYHKHPCVVVLGRGEEAEKQLFEWLQWFDKNNFHYKGGLRSNQESFGEIERLLGQHRYSSMIRKNS